MSPTKMGRSIITNEASIIFIKFHYLRNDNSSRLVSFEPCSHAATLAPLLSAGARGGRWREDFVVHRRNCPGKSLSALTLPEYIASSGLELLPHLS